MRKYWPLQCCKCGRFIGKDGYPDVIWDDYQGGYEEGYSYCGPCGRGMGYPDRRIDHLVYLGKQANGSHDFRCTCGETLECTREVFENGPYTSKHCKNCGLLWSADDLTACMNKNNSRSAS